MDAVSLHCPKNEETTNMFSENEFKIMKESAFLINCARGGIINEMALLDALKSNKIRAAGLDVYEKEPLPESHKLRFVQNALLLPHIGYVTAENYSTFYNQMIENLDSFVSGKPQRVIE